MNEEHNTVILLIEDNPGDARIISELVAEIGSEGFALQCVNRFSAGLDVLGGQEVGLVLLDLGLPDSQGLDSVRRLREERPGVPIIVLTGLDDGDLALDAVREGAQDYLVKGQLGPDSLARAIRYAIERHRTIESLKRSEQRYRMLTDTANDTICILTADGFLVEANPRMSEILGYPVTEMLGKHIRSFSAPGHEGENADDYQRDVGAGGVRHSRPVRLVTAGGNTVLMEFSSTTVEVGGETLVYTIGRDVTQQTRMREELEQTSRGLAELQKFEAIGRLAGGIAHDFNNVLGAISGWAQLCLEEAVPASRLHARLERICRQTENAAGLTHQLLAFARRQVLEPRPVDANAVITDAVALLRKLVSEQVELRIILAPEPPIALADKTQMEQVLMNLALNARDAMPDGGQLVIESHVVDIDEEYVRLHKHAQTGRYVLLTVTDTGIGMDDDTRNRIFEPFFTTKETGHGLGLATVYGIVKQHQGFIHVYSEPGVGTTFRTYLPTAAESVEVVVPHPVEARLRGTECILLAEDHEGMREMVREILEELGYTLLVAANGEEAVRVFEAHSNAVDLVILDVIMPKLNGPDAYERMRALRSDLPVVFASGYSTEVDREIVRNQGHPYLQKPYDPGVLKRKVREVLNLAK